jgi:hypothetical protein
MALFSKKYLSVPTELTFHPKAHSDDVILNKQTVKIDPYTSKTTFLPGDDIQIKITGDKAVDLRTIILNFTCRMKNSAGVTQGTGDAIPAFENPSDIFWSSNPKYTEALAALNECPVVHFHNWIGSIFRTFNLRLNDTVQIENIDHYNRLRHALSKLTVNNGYKCSQYGAMEGWHPDWLDPLASTSVGYSADGASGIPYLSNNNRCETETPLVNTQYHNSNDGVFTYTATATQLIVTSTNGAQTPLIPNGTQLITSGTTPDTWALADKVFVQSLATISTNVYTYNIQNPNSKTITTGGTEANLSFVEQYHDLSSRPTIRNISYYDRYRAGVIERQYSIRLDLSGLLGRLPKLLYLPTIGSLDMYMRFEDPAKVINLDDQASGPVSYEVTNIHTQCEMFDLSQAYLNSLKTVLDDQGMVLELDTYLTYEFPLDQSSAQTIRLWRRLVSLKGIYFGIYRENQDLKYERKKTDVLSRYDHAGLKEYQLYIDGRPVQAHPIQTEVLFPSGGADIKDLNPNKSISSEAEWEIMKALRYHGDIRTSPFYDRHQRENSNQHAWKAQRQFTDTGDAYTGAKNEYLYNNNDFQALPFSLYAVDLEKSDLLSGTSLSNELALQLRFNADSKSRLEKTISRTTDDSTTAETLNFQYKLFMFLHYDKRVIVHSGLRITEVE